MPGKIQLAERADSGVALHATRPDNVIAFPVFEDHGDQILEWLSEMGPGNPGVRTVARLLRSMRSAVLEIGRVRNSLRHSNLASFLKHATNALEAGEFEGARYLLMTAHALLAARAVTAGNFREGHLDAGPAEPRLLEMRQFSFAAGPGAAVPATGIVAG